MNHAMSTLRLFSLPTHAVLELLCGVALLGSPFALAFGTAGTVVAFGLGVLLVGLALGGADDLPISTHVAFDQALTVVLLAAAVALALTGDRVAASALLAAGVAQLALTATTRYSRPAGR
jgi:hypothetical protein